MNMAMRLHGRDKDENRYNMNDDLDLVELGCVPAVGDQIVERWMTGCRPDPLDWERRTIPEVTERYFHPGKWDKVGNTTCVVPVTTKQRMQQTERALL